MCSSGQQRDVDSLFNIKMNEGETLSEYVQHFSATLVQANAYDDVMTEIAFQCGLLPNSYLHMPLHKKKPESMEESSTLEEAWIK